MLSTARITLLGLAVVFGSVGLARSQCATTCEYVSRGDRFEGVIGSRQSSANSLQLIGVHYQPDSPADGRSPNLHLFFWLPSPETPAIEVWQPTQNYWMVPTKKLYSKGLQGFSWPRQDVVGPLKLRLDSLYVKVGNRTETLYFPALLAASDRPVPAGRYLFIFMSDSAFDAALSIAHEAQGRLVTVRSFPLRQEEPGIHPFPWDGRDDRGIAMSEGIYFLCLKGHFLGEKITPFKSTIRFLKYGQFE